MSEFLNAPHESSGPKLFDRWSGLSYLPLPSAHQAQRIFVAVGLINYMVDRAPAYVPPLDVFLKPLRLLNDMVKDADRSSFESYERLYLRQGGSRRLNVLRRSYSAAHCGLLSANVERKSTPLLELVMDAANLDVADAVMVLDGANAAMSAYAAYRIEGFERQLPIQDAVAWFVERWSEQVYKN